MPEGAVGNETGEDGPPRRRVVDVPVFRRRLEPARWLEIGPMSMTVRDTGQPAVVGHGSIREEQPPPALAGYLALALGRLEAEQEPRDGTFGEVGLDMREDGFSHRLVRLADDRGGVDVQPVGTMAVDEADPSGTVYHHHSGKHGFRQSVSEWLERGRLLGQRTAIRLERGVRRPEGVRRRLQPEQDPSLGAGRRLAPRRAVVADGKHRRQPHRHHGGGEMAFGIRNEKNPVGPPGGH